ncbi:MAG TPA: site-specific DNA-methyltransferase [Luteolibacter sp.]
MDKLDLHTPDFTTANIDRIAELFPNCITETKTPGGTVKRAIDFDLLRQELSHDLVEGPQERYRLDWPGKRAALALANEPIRKTLRPNREESVDFDTTKNLYIEGDNLDALKLLQETYLGKVKMIYIDPPYNTGNDFIYDDDFSMSRSEYESRSGEVDEEGNAMFDEEKWKQNSSSNGRFHSEWLSMMYPRLKLARNLLRDDGLIFISIDEGEHANLRAACNEVFGESNFVESITWKKRYGAGGGTKGFAKLHDYILVYSKTAIENIDAPLSEEQIAAYSLKDEKFPTRGGYVTQPLATSSKGERSNLMYAIEHEGVEILPKKGTRWLWSKEKLLSAYHNNEVVINKSASGYSVRFKQYLKNENGQIRRGKPLSILAGVWNQDGTDELTNIYGNKGIFDFPKPSRLLKFLFSFSVNDKDTRDDIILDFFSGSATTAHAVMQLNAEDGGNRRHIMVQLPEPCDEKSEAFKAGYKTIAEIGKERIRRAGKKILAEWQAKQAKENAAQGDLFHPQSPPDIGFRVLKIDSSNMADVYYQPDELKQDDLLHHVDNLQKGRTPEDFLFQVLLDWGIDLALPVTEETIEGRRVFFVGDAPDIPGAQPEIAACFDTGLDETFIKALAKRVPLRAVFRDAGYASDAVKINIEQIFKALSPRTELKTL